MADQVLLRNEKITVSFDPTRSVVTMRRTAVDLPRDRDGLRAFYREVVAALDLTDRPNCDLIADGRAAVGRNDDVFESVQSEFTEGLFGGFRSVVGVVATTAGMLQVNRYDNDVSRSTTPVFGSTEAAHEYLSQRH